MSELALQLIAENKRTRAKRLDLGRCGMTMVPDEIGNLWKWLEVLVLSNRCWDTNSRKWVDSPNDGDENQLSALPDALSRLSGLKTLFLHGGSGKKWKLHNLSPLSGLTNLRALTCFDTQVSDLSPLSGLTSLRTLLCSSTQVSELTPLRRLTSLRALDCSFTQVDDLSPLSDLTNMHKLTCFYTRVSDLSPLSGLTSLRTLSCTSTEMADLSPLRDLTSLQTLSCSRTQVSDLSPLSDLTNLRKLTCSSTRVGDLSPLKDLTSLQTLDCSYTQVSDLSPLSGLTNLQTLDCSRTQIDLTPLSRLTSLTNLQTLYHAFTPVSDLSPLKDLTSLQTLSCSGTQVRKLEPISALPSLKIFHFNGCPIDDCPANVWQSGDAAQLRSFFLGKQGEAEAPTKLRRKRLPQLDGRRDVKLILLGNSAVGKTNLVHWLTEEEYLGNRKSTHGLEVRRWLPDAAQFPALAHLAVNIWDFGGQEYYHGAYRLFMSANAAYLLLWCQDTDVNGRRDTVLLDGSKAVPLEHFEKRYWLDTVRHYGGLTTAPLVVVQNKTDDLDGDKRRLSQELHEAYGIGDSFHISLQRGCSPDFPRQQRLLAHFAAELAETLAAAADKTEDVADWQLIRHYVLQLREDGKYKKNPFAKYLQEEIWVSLDDFKKACGELLGRPLTQDAVNEVHTLPRLLDKGGAAVFFPDHPQLGDRLFLRPDRLAERIYAVLNSTVLAKGGEFWKDDLEEKLPERRVLLLEIARQLGLVFPTPTADQGITSLRSTCPKATPSKTSSKSRRTEPGRRAFGCGCPCFFTENCSTTCCSTSPPTPKPNRGTSGNTASCF